MNWIYFYPILLATCGIAIHALGLFGIAYLHAPFWGHLVMLLIDSAVVLGLLLKSSWGYWLGVILYLEQVYIQTLSLHHAGWFASPSHLQIPVPFLCLIALVLLVLNKKSFTGQSS